MDVFLAPCLVESHRSWRAIRGGQPLGGSVINSSSPQSASLDWIQRLVSLDTTSRDSNLELIAAVRTEADRLGLLAAEIPNADKTKANLIITVPAADGRTTGGIMLSGHTDVVPVDGQNWSSEPFTPQIREGRLYGRGSVDMKGFVGSAVAALTAFSQTALTEPVHLALSYDEEVGCGGAVELVRHLSTSTELPRICIVGEPTNMRVITGHKSIDLRNIVFHGRAAHSSLTPQGVNSIEYAAQAITFIRGMAEEYARSGAQDSAYLVPYTTLSVNMINGGIAANTVPELCSVLFEARSLTAAEARSTVAQIEARVRELESAMQAEHPEATIEFINLGSVPGLSAQHSGLAREFAVDAGGIDTDDKVTYGTEAGLFEQAGISTVVCGPGDIAQAHAANEYIELGQIAACDQFIESIRRSLTQPT